MATLFCKNPFQISGYTEKNDEYVYCIVVQVISQNNLPANIKMSLYKISRSKAATGGEDATVDGLRLEGMYMQKDRVLKMGSLITSEIQKRLDKIPTEERMEMYRLKDKMMAWLNDFQQQGRSDIDLKPVFQRVKDMLLIWNEDGL